MKNIKCYTIKKKTKNKKKLNIFFYEKQKNIIKKLNILLMKNIKCYILNITK